MKRDKRQKKKQKEQSKQRTRRKQQLKKKRRSLHEKAKRRRKRDCILGMPFIIAFQGDPAQLFYCADHPRTFELIPRTNEYPFSYKNPLARLAQYLQHHVTQIHEKVLIYKAG